MNSLRGSNAVYKCKPVTVFAFLVLPIGFLLLFLVYPAMRLFELSFSDWNGIRRTYAYVGVLNYVRALTDRQMWSAFLNNGRYFFAHLLSFPFCILLAAVLNSKIKGDKFLRSLIFLPYVLNGVAVAYIFVLIYNPLNGPLNELLNFLGLSVLKRGWLGDPSVVNHSLVFVSLWRWTGFNTILFLAGLQAIPDEQYEAARIDGATWLQQQRYITIPGLKRVIEIVLFLNARGALQIFDTPFLMTGGGPGMASATFTLYTVQSAFWYRSYGFASALAIILIVLIVAVNIIQKTVVRLED